MEYVDCAIAPWSRLNARATKGRHGRKRCWVWQNLELVETTMGLLLGPTARVERKTKKSEPYGNMKPEFKRVRIKKSEDEVMS